MWTRLVYLFNKRSKLLPLKRVFIYKIYLYVDKKLVSVVLGLMNVRLKHISNVETNIVVQLLRL